MQSIKGFEKLGLSGRDSRVYVTLLTEGLSSVRTISEHSGINRGSVYESIKALVAAGLVNYQQANVNKKYFANEPEKILELIAKRKEELTELEQVTTALIPKLTQSAAHLPYANITFFEGDEGIANILHDVIKTVETTDPKEYYVISSKPMRKYIYGKFNNFTTKRVHKKLHVKVIAIGSGGDDAPYSERRWLQVESTSRPYGYTIVYGNKYAMISLNDSMNPYGVVIDDQGASHMQKMIFDTLWKSAVN